MYNVNQKMIEEILQNMNQLLEMVEPIKNTDLQIYMNDQITKLATERVLHIVIESIADVGNYLIDGFIMRDPGGYIDIIDILEDEKVIPNHDAEKLKRVVGLRKSLVHDYTKINSEEVYFILKEEYNTLLNFAGHVREYLGRELF